MLLEPFTQVPPEALGEGVGIDVPGVGELQLGEEELELQRNAVLWTAVFFSVILPSVDALTALRSHVEQTVHVAGSALIGPTKLLSSG
jgi:hypothetical protein